MRHDPEGVGLVRWRDPLLPRVGFRSIELNLVGWSALMGAGLLVGLVLLMATSLPPAAAFPLGVVLVLLVVLALDLRRWRNLWAGLGDSRLTPEKGAVIVDRLRRSGVEASYESIVDEDEDGVFEQRSIQCRNADVAKARVVMAEVLGSR